MIYLSKFRKELREAIIAGLKSLCCDVTMASKLETKPQRDDILITWTIWNDGMNTRHAAKFREAGARIICIEGGWLRGRGHYQIAWRVGYDCGFNGWGDFPAGDGSRWAQMGFELKPWVQGGDYVLVCGNKGNEFPHRINPQISHHNEWPDEIIKTIRKHTDMPIHYRPHPKGFGTCVPRKNLPDVLIDPKKETIHESLERAAVVVVWASSTASQAICAGVPVIYRAERIMCRELATRRIDRINNPPTPDRLPVLERLAWAQWTIDEIRAGEPFRHLGVI